VNKLYISEHFRLDEFESSDTKEAKVDEELVEKLELLRAELGNQPLIINSAYRTPEHNKAIGGAENSLHMTGKAVDIAKVDDYDIDEMANIAEQIGFDGIGKYNWGIHVDVRGYKARWDDRGQE